MNRLLPVLALLAGCTEGRSDGGRACTLLGCQPGMTVGIGPIDDPTPYLDALLTMCVNERCSSVMLPAVVPPSNVGYGSHSTVVPLVTVSLSSRPDGRYGVSVTLDEAETHDDTYSIEIVDTNGAVLVEHAWTASYIESFPNGIECGPPCLHQSIELTP